MIRINVIVSICKKCNLVSPLSRKKPDNIDAAMWQRFLAFEKFERLKKAKSQERLLKSK